MTTSSTSELLTSLFNYLFYFTKNIFDALAGAMTSILYMLRDILYTILAIIRNILFAIVDFFKELANRVGYKNNKIWYLRISKNPANKYNWYIFRNLYYYYYYPILYIKILLYNLFLKNFFLMSNLARACLHWRAERPEKSRWTEHKDGVCSTADWWREDHCGGYSEGKLFFKMQYSKVVSGPCWAKISPSTSRETGRH